MLSAAAVIPLAGQIGAATEAIAERVGPGIGGLLNATFGNAAELIISVFALKAGLDGVVKASITGSIIGNVLLVLGASLLAGGIRFSVQSFNRTAAGVGATMMVLAAFAMLVPAVFHRLVGPKDAALEHKLSLAVSVASDPGLFPEPPLQPGHPPRPLQPARRGESRRRVRLTDPRRPHAPGQPLEAGDRSCSFPRHSSPG